MATIETVLGPIEASELGATLSHEHVVGVAGQERWYYPWRFDMERTKEIAIADLLEVKADGIDSIIDLTTPDLGRDVALLRELSRASGVHVVAATGMWRDVPRAFADRDIDESASIFVREIEVGIDDTGIKAGAIKMANDIEGIGAKEEAALRAAARASIQTGCPISTHHWAPIGQGTEQVRIFREEGVPMHQVCIGHSADSKDVDYLESLLEAGVYVSMDRYPGRPDRPNWQERNATLRALIDRGWAHRLMIGQDSWTTRVVPAGMREAPTDGYNPDGLHFLKRVAIPALLEDGVPEETIDVLLRDTPRRFLTGEQ